MDILKKHIIYLLSITHIASYGCAPSPPPVIPNISSIQYEESQEEFKVDSTIKSPAAVIISDGDIGKLNDCLENSMDAFLGECYEKHGPRKGGEQTLNSDVINKEKLGRMAFRPRPGGASNKDLNDVIQTCARLSDTNMHAQEELNLDAEMSEGIVGGVLGGLLGVAEVGSNPLGAILLILYPHLIPITLVLGGTYGGITGDVSYNSKLEPYRKMQRCVEYYGYICEGFCPDVQDVGDEGAAKPHNNCGYDGEVSSAFLAYNIWVSSTEDEFCINYKIGRMLPAGTEVINMAVENGLFSKKISFTIKATCEKNEIEFKPRWHPGKTAEDYYKIMFTDKDFDGLTAGFKESEIQSIKRGTLIEGMSKEAVLLSYGYPPEHRTTNLEENLWVYWYDKTFQVNVNFDEGVTLNNPFLSNYQTSPNESNTKEKIYTEEENENEHTETSTRGISDRKVFLNNHIMGLTSQLLEIRATGRDIDRENIIRGKIRKAKKELQKLKAQENNRQLPSI